MKLYFKGISFTASVEHICSARATCWLKKRIRLFHDQVVKGPLLNNIPLLLVDAVQPKFEEIK